MVQGLAKKWSGGEGFIAIQGTLDGASVTPQFSLNDSNWLDLDSSVVLSASRLSTNFKLPKGYIRGVTSNAGASTSFDVPITTY